MSKVIATMNMTIDGYCDHTEGIADDELHDHYTELLRGANSILYGRTTFQLMEFWPTLLKNPSGTKALDDFAIAIDRVPKIVFSNTLKTLEWKTARLATQSLKDEISTLKQSEGPGDIYIGSPSLIVQATNLGLVDEFQLCVHPIIVGKGLPLFKNLSEKWIFALTRTKTFGSGCVLHYYQPLAK